MPLLLEFETFYLRFKIYELKSMLVSPPRYECSLAKTISAERNTIYVIPMVM